MVSERWDLIVVDVDDTIYPQQSYLRSAVSAVSAHAAQHWGISAELFSNAFTAALLEGSDKGGRIDASLHALGIEPADGQIADLVNCFTMHRPVSLELYDGAREALDALACLAPVVAFTDGNPRIQNAKLEALAMSDWFADVCITDTIGGRITRKPCIVGLEHLCFRAGAHDPSRVLVIGDRPAKDVAAAIAFGACSIRVRTGEYANTPDSPAPNWTASTLREAASIANTTTTPAGHRHTSKD